MTRGTHSSDQGSPQQEDSDTDLHRSSDVCLLRVRSGDRGEQSSLPLEFSSLGWGQGATCWLWEKLQQAWLKHQGQASWRRSSDWLSFEGEQSVRPKAGERSRQWEQLQQGLWSEAAGTLEAWKRRAGAEMESSPRACRAIREGQKSQVPVGSGAPKDTHLKERPSSALPQLPPWCPAPALTHNLH